MSNLKDFYTLYDEPLNISAYKYDFQSLDFIFLNSCTKEYIDELMNCWLPRLKFGGIIGGHTNGNQEIIDIVSDNFGPINIFNKNCWWMYKTNSKIS